MRTIPIRELANHDIGTVIEASTYFALLIPLHLQIMFELYSQLSPIVRNYIFKFTSGFLPEIAAKDVVYHFLRFKLCFCMFCNAHDSARPLAYGSGRINLTADDPT